MKLFMDIHQHVPGLTIDDVTKAHARDLEIQGKYNVKYLKYWYDTKSGKIFCLVEAPDKDSAAKVHRESHGLVADEIIEVHEGL